MLGRYAPSSFSRFLAEYRKLDFHDGWYSACAGWPPRYFTADEIGATLYTHWSLCPQNCTALPPGAAKRLGSFGWEHSCIRGTGPSEAQELPPPDTAPLRP